MTKPIIGLDEVEFDDIEDTRPPNARRSSIASAPSNSATT